MKEFYHFPVMLNEAVNFLKCSRGGVFIDATLGAGGYSNLILEQLPPEGRLISFDIDKNAVKAASERLKKYTNVTIIKDSYTNIKKYLEKNNIPEITGGIVFDLGASTPQLTSAERGFSFLKDAPLDMRFNQESQYSAYDVVNGMKETDLVRIFSEYGEERFSKRIAKKIIEKRKIKKIETTKELADVVLEAAPRIKSKIHPATRVFQAVRIEVNNELNNIKNTLKDVIPLLADGAIITVVSFHSLEDRIVKNIFKEYAAPVRGGGESSSAGLQSGSRKLPMLEIITKKPLTASEEEIKENPPSRSAKLRTAAGINKNINGEA